MIDESDLPGDRNPGIACRRCGRRSPIDFRVDDEVWQAVAGPYMALCPSCFDELADKLDVPYVFREIHVATWSQWNHEKWPWLEGDCAECAGRQRRGRYLRRRLAKLDEKV